MPEPKEKKNLTLIEFTDKGLRIKNNAELFRLAEIVAKAPGFCPKGFIGKPHEITLCMAAGAELGFTPIRSLQTVCVINGKASVYGEGMTELLQNHPDFEGIEEIIEGDVDKGTYSVTIKLHRRNRKFPAIGEFDMADAKRAGLFKNDVWNKYPKDMCYWKALARAKRKGFSDIGATIAEDLVGVDASQQTEPASRPIRTIKADSVDDWMEQAETQEQPEHDAKEDATPQQAEPEPEPEAEAEPEPEETEAAPSRDELLKQLDAEVADKKLSQAELSALWNEVDPMGLGADNMDDEQLEQLVIDIQKYRVNRRHV